MNDDDYIGEDDTFIQMIENLYALKDAISIDLNNGEIETINPLTKMKLSKKRVKKKTIEEFIRIKYTHSRFKLEEFIIIKKNIDTKNYQIP